MTESPAPASPDGRRHRHRWVVPAAVAAALAVLTAGALALRPGGGSDRTLVASARSTEPPSSTVAPSTTAAAPPSTAGPNAAPPAAPPAAAPPSTIPTARGAPARHAGSGAALCIGDSVMLGASPGYRGTLSMCGAVDAAESRQFAAGPGLVAGRPLPTTVVVHLGTNGTISPSDLDAVLGRLAGVPRVVLVTVQVSGRRPWEGPDNALIRTAPDHHPNVAVADWKAASDGHRDWLGADGIHLTAAGAAGYAATIAAAL
jgi:hypothetical protein